MRSTVLKYACALARNTLRGLKESYSDFIYLSLVICLVLLFLGNGARSILRSNRTFLHDNLDQIRRLLPLIFGLVSLISGSHLFRRALAWYSKSWLLTLPFSRMEILAFASSAAALGLAGSLFAMAALTFAVSVILSLSWVAAFGASAVETLLWALPATALVPSVSMVGITVIRKCRLQNALLIKLSSLISLLFLGAVYGLFWLSVSRVLTPWPVAGRIALLGALLPLLAGLLYRAIRQRFLHKAADLFRQFETQEKSFAPRALPAFVHRLIDILDARRVRYMSTLLIKTNTAFGFSRYHSFLAASPLGILLLFVGLKVSIQSASGLALGITGGLIATFCFTHSVHATAIYYRMLRTCPVSYGTAVKSLARLGGALALVILILACLPGLLLGPGSAALALCTGAAIVLLLCPLWLLILLAFVESVFAAHIIYAICLVLPPLFLEVSPLFVTPFFILVFFVLGICIETAYFLRKSREAWTRYELY